MPAAGGGFEQGYNAQAAGRRAAFWWWRQTWSRRPTTRTRSNRCWTRSAHCPKAWARSNICLYTGYFSAGNVAACEKAGVEPVIAMADSPITRR